MQKNQYLPIQSKHRVLADSQLYIAMLHTQFMALLKKYQQLWLYLKRKSITVISSVNRWNFQRSFYVHSQPVTNAFPHAYVILFWQSGDAEDLLRQPKLVFLQVTVIIPLQSSADFREFFTTHEWILRVTRLRDKIKLFFMLPLPRNAFRSSIALPLWPLSRYAKSSFCWAGPPNGNGAILAIWMRSKQNTMINVDIWVKRNRKSL